MKITADTNLLVRLVVKDDATQARTAFQVLSAAELVAIPLPCLCEVAWVLERVYRYRPAELAVAISSIVEPNNVIFDRAGVESGLQMLKAGGDFADGAIAPLGNSMGGETFISFDRKAIVRLNALGLPARNARNLA